MRDKHWNRSDVIAGLRDDVWRHLTQAANSEDEIALEASRLLRMSTADVRTLAQLHFVLSDEAARLLAQMPSLARRLSTTAQDDREVSAERVRGAIRWGETVSLRAATGMPNLFVTSPARRAFDTPENQLLAFSLAAIAQFGRLTGWQDSTSKGVGEIVRTRTTDATRWGQVRALSELKKTPPAPTTVARVRTGRKRQLYSSALSVHELYQEFISRLNRDSIRSAVENHALVTRDDPVLLELLTTFATIKALRDQGWEGKEVGLVGGGRVFRARRADEQLQLFYQHAPPPLKAGSLYRQIQRDHEFRGTGGLIPDLVLRIEGSHASVRWVLIEVKGVDRSVADSARHAVSDLLAYRRAFDPVLSEQPGPYGVGVAWGELVKPSTTQADVVLCSPDTIPAALKVVLDG